MFLYSQLEGTPLFFAIIDDLGADNFIPEQILHLFVVNPYNGLDEETSKRIVYFLSNRKL